MGKRVVVIASGETERRALPHLLAGLQAEGVTLLEVRIPPGHRALGVEMAEKLVKAAWFERISAPPDKFVILIDADGKDPDAALAPFRTELAGRLGPSIKPALQFAHAQWHLEAWYFADQSALRDYLNLSLGSVDASSPDSIQRPKQHLQHLLGERVYTAVVSEEIARTLDPLKIQQRSPSFQGLLSAVRDGELPP